MYLGIIKLAKMTKTKNTLKINSFKYIENTLSLKCIEIATLKNAL